MSLSISSRLKLPKKMELMKSQSQAQLLANKLRNDGVMSTVESVMQAVDQLAALLSSNQNDPNISYRESIINLCQHLKVYGAYLEMLYTDQLNHAFNVFRDKAQEDTRVDQLSRLHLLELIELRAKGWKGTEGMNQYYRKRVNQFSQNDSMIESTNSLADSLNSLPLSSSSPMLNPGEVLKSSGKFSKPTRIPGKKYCKDEVVIRNADSGKVSPGAKERLVQITGANEESICLAKQIMEDTIRRNASPVREHGMSVGGPLTGSSSSINSSASDDSALPSSARASRALMHSLSVNDATIGEYKYTVVVGNHTIRIMGDNLELVRTSKLVLDEFFSGEPVNDVTQFYSFDSLPQSGASTNDLTEVPLSPPASPPPPILNEPKEQPDETGIELKLRKPRVSIEEILQGKTMSVETTSKKENRLVYSIEYLATLAMSPICLGPPQDWERISNDYPALVREVIEYFNAKQYLNDRKNEAKCNDDVLDNGEV
ncbi:eukaryotic translation initiation factor 4E-binding protein Mextli isoform X2 [Coccinella septempunctata]|uniref:eukaryotic translation initiation factor 4E-binding protein Mextli isoform X2 n=1 Tax=Coccinella septempunctata TaxID=41139 RepID=UPI001D094163|nr:eukaryotic translation initiation factor 4E-binding protein Mextli isoform X2 [Coccinella septempunctata]